MDASGQIQGSIHGRYDIMRLTSPGFGVQFNGALLCEGFFFTKTQKDLRHVCVLDVYEHFSHPKKNLRISIYNR